MKAFLLAAGLGTRLRPLTDEMPKCMLPIGGKPLVAIWLEHLARNGVDEVLINTHHHSVQVEEFVAKHNGPPKVKLVYEPMLLGSGGTIWANRYFVEEEGCFLVIYADNLTNVDLCDMVRFHRHHGGILTMGLFESSTPAACGIVEIEGGDGRNGLITRFEEKPSEPKGNLANAGIYVANKEIFDAFPLEPGLGEGPLDFGHHILQRLLGQMYGYLIDGLLIDIGTIENYELAQQAWDREGKIELRCRMSEIRRQRAESIWERGKNG